MQHLDTAVFSPLPIDNWEHMVCVQSWTIVPIIIRFRQALKVGRFSARYDNNVDEVGMEHVVGRNTNQNITISCIVTYTSLRIWGNDGRGTYSGDIFNETFNHVSVPVGPMGTIEGAFVEME